MCESNCVTKKECVLLIFPETSNTDMSPSLVHVGSNFEILLAPKMFMFAPRNVASMAGPKRKIIR